MLYKITMFCFQLDSKRHYHIANISESTMHGAFDKPIKPIAVYTFQPKWSFDSSLISPSKFHGILKIAKGFLSVKSRARATLKLYISVSSTCKLEQLRQTISTIGVNRAKRAYINVSWCNLHYNYASPLNLAHFDIISQC